MVYFNFEQNKVYCEQIWQNTKCEGERKKSNFSSDIHLYAEWKIFSNGEQLYIRLHSIYLYL